jgi:hypothetical protein
MEVAVQALATLALFGTIIRRETCFAVFRVQLFGLDVRRLAWLMACSRNGMFASHFCRKFRPGFVGRVLGVRRNEQFSLRVNDGSDGCCAAVLAGRSLSQIRFSDLCIALGA